MKSSNPFILPLICIILLTASCTAGKKISRNGNRLLDSPALANAHTGISIVDATSGAVLYSHEAGKYFVPASNTKIATCYAMMSLLGDSVPALRYHINADSSIDIGGTGDPVFLTSEFESDRIIGFLKKFRVINWHESLFEENLGSGRAWDDYQDDYMVQRSPLPMYGNVARFNLAKNGTITSMPPAFAGDIKTGSAPGADGMRVQRDWDRNEFTILPGTAHQQVIPFNTTPGTMRELLEEATGVTVTMDPFNPLPQAASSILYSVPVDSLLRPMMHRSDNFYAEQCLMLLGDHLVHEFNIGKTTETLLQSVLADLPQRPRWADGSGLSRYNLFTPQDMVSILRKIIALPRGTERLKTVFATGGEGTLKNFYKQEAGNVYAKTGTLSGVVCVSGILTTKKGRVCCFSVMVNNNRSSSSDVRREVETFIRSVIRSN